MRVRARVGVRLRGSLGNLGARARSQALLGPSHVIVHECHEVIDHICLGYRTESRVSGYEHQSQATASGHTPACTRNHTRIHTRTPFHPLTPTLPGTSYHLSPTFYRPPLPSKFYFLLSAFYLLHVPSTFYLQPSRSRSTSTSTSTCTSSSTLLSSSTGILALPLLRTVSAQTRHQPRTLYTSSFPNP